MLYVYTDDDENLIYTIRGERAMLLELQNVFYNYGYNTEIRD